MYCPNCGKKQKSESTQACPSCAMPLAEVAGETARFRQTVPQEALAPSIPRERLFGAAAFLAIAAVPIGLGVKNSLLKKG